MAAALQPGAAVRRERAPEEMVGGSGGTCLPVALREEGSFPRAGGGRFFPAAAVLPATAPVLLNGGERWGG